MAEKIGTKMNLTGQKFGRWTVLYEVKPRLASDGRYERLWHCRCDCGTEKDVLQRTLRAGLSNSCGCLHKEVINGPNVKNRRSNKFDLSHEYGIGYTTKGIAFYFDKDDYELIKEYCWYTRNKDCNSYVISYDKNSRHHIILSRLVMGLPWKDNRQLVDHINHNKLDNRKANLRIVTYSQNFMNKDKGDRNKSGCVGVCRNSRNDNWRAYINIHGKQIYLGSYAQLEDAIQARKKGEEKYFGEYSYDNSQELASKYKIKD